MIKSCHSITPESTPGRLVLVGLLVSLTLFTGCGRDESDGDGCVYPDGATQWGINDIVPDDSFPARLGSDGPDTELKMLDAHCDSEVTKALVFAFGTKDCSSCPARFSEIGEMEGDINAAGAELIGIYYESLSTGVPMTTAEVSAEMDAYGWTGGWRASDADGILWNAGGGFLVPAFPWEFIIDTSTMRLVAITSLGSELDILEELSKIN